MQGNYNRAFDLLLTVPGNLEGQHGQLPNDPGAEDYLGISKTFYPDVFAELQKSSWEQQHEIARNFYYKEFWLRFNCDALPDKIDILYFVTAVNTPRGEKMISLAIDNFENECLDLILYYINTKNDDNRKLGLIKRVLRTWMYLNKGIITI